MKLSQFKQALEASTRFVKEWEDPEVVIPLSTVFPSVGGQPCLPVTRLGLGFDWDKGKLFISGEEKLAKYSDIEPETVQKLRKDLDSWAWQTRQVEAENKKLKKELAKLKETNDLT